MVGLDIDIENEMWEEMEEKWKIVENEWEGMIKGIKEKKLEEVIE